MFRQKANTSPIKYIDFASRSQHPVEDIEQSVNEASPFKPGEDKTYNPIVGNTTQLKKSMFHILEKDLMPRLPYMTITNITIGDKHFNLREFKREQHIGFVLYENGDIYFGEVSNFKRHGKGIFVNDLKNETFYGDFLDDFLDGSGRYYYSNGNICVGNWSRGYFNGQQMIYNKNTDTEYRAVYNMGEQLEITKLLDKSDDANLRYCYYVYNVI